MRPAIAFVDDSIGKSLRIGFAPEDAHGLQEIYRLDIRDRPALLFAMMRAFAIEGAQMSLEGNLAQTEVMHLDSARHDETDSLKRATIEPRLDFIVLPLFPSTVDAIERSIRSKIAFAGYRGIIHVQIEIDGKLVFVAYDNFHEACVYTDTQVSSGLLDHLKETRVLRSYQRVQQPGLDPPA